MQVNKAYENMLCLSAVGYHRLILLFMLFIYIYCFTFNLIRVCKALNLTVYPDFIIWAVATGTLQTSMRCTAEIWRFRFIKTNNVM